MSSQNINFFLNIKNIREKNNLSISELSSKTLLNKRTIESYEFKNTTHTYKNLYKIVKFYGISIDYLLLCENTNFIKNIFLLKLAEKLDKLSLQEMNKVDSYIDTFLNKEKEISKHYDVLNYNFSNNFNNNFKIIMEQNNITGKEMSKRLSVTERQIAGYKKSSECSYNILFKISNIFNISIHWLLTGKKLIFNFNNKKFEENILKADEHLENKYLDNTIDLIKGILKNNNIPIE